MITMTMKGFDTPDYTPLEAILRNFTYKPDWRFEIRGGLLLISIIAVDTDDHTKTIQVNFSHGIPSLVREDFPWTRWLLDQIIEVELHEAQEFFKIDGVKVFDPHG